MKKIVLTMFCLLFCVQSICLAIDLEDVDDMLGQLGIKDAIESTVGIDIDKVTNYLDWDAINISVQADMTNTTETQEREFQVGSTIYKSGITKIRIDINDGLEIPGKFPSDAFDNLYILRYLITKKAYMVSPSKKTYMELEPGKGREMLGELKERFDFKLAKIKEKEKLGTEDINGYLCDKVHVIMVSNNGTENDIMAWLALDLKNFPIQIISNFKTNDGKNGTNTTIFSNIKEMIPDESLFEIPEGYVECDNKVELLSGGKFGSKLKKKRR